jgi:thymidylate synthase (FAD)
MKIIKPSYTILEQQPGIDGVLQMIELAGRTCYKSEDKITEDSAKPFVDRMINSKHYAMLEHGTVYLKIPFGKMLDNGEFENEALAHWFVDNPYSWVKTGGVGTEDCWYVTSNYRVLIEKDLLHTLQYLCEPTEFHEKRITVHFVCDRGSSHEFVRHRVMSFAQESTRYRAIAA